MARTFARIALGTALVLHGLGNAVLPLRGVDQLGPGQWSAWIIVLYELAILGFVAAGLGVLGIRMLRRVAREAAIVSGAASLIGWFELGQRDLWLGLILNVLLPYLTIVWLRWSQPASSSLAHPRWRLVVESVGWAFFAWMAASSLLWPFHRSWGTTPAEWAVALPGDRTPRTPSLELLHGVTIDAPPDVVWSWLIQLGQDRAGFYSYERLERLFGAQVHNVFERRPEWQSRQVGEHVPATQSGYLGGVFGDRPGWTVDLVEPNRALVLRNWGAFVLEPRARHQTRLLIRSTISNERIPAWAAGINLAAFELPHFIMQRRMMLTLKSLAERS
jgi:hypothetical protein